MPEGGVDIPQNLISKPKDGLELSEKEGYTWTDVWEAARYVLKYPTMGIRLQLFEFSGSFSKAEIASAENYVKEKQSRIDAKDGGRHISHERSEAAEEILGSRIGEFGWLGKSTKLIRTTLYDDYKGIDGVAEFMGEGKVNRLAVVVDATTNTNEDTIRTKFEYNIARILNNASEVKFFKSRLTDFVGSLKDCIPTVVGFDNKTVGRLIMDFADLTWIMNKQGKTEQDIGLIEEKKNSLMNDPAQIIVIEEMQFQMEMFRNIIEKADPNKELYVSVEQVDELLDVIGGLFEEKGNLVDDPDIEYIRQTDGVYNLIKKLSEEYEQANDEVLGKIKIEKNVFKH